MADLSGYYKRADQAFSKGNYDYARDLYLQILSLAPNECEARRKLFATLVKKFKEQGGRSKLTTKLFLGGTMGKLSLTKNPDKRIEIAQRHLLTDPMNDRVRAELAAALSEKGCPDGALEEARIATEINPRNPLANKLAAKILIEKGEPDQARACLTRAIREHPEDREAEKLLRDLEATATMKKGFEGAKSYREVLKSQDEAEFLEKQQHMVKTEEDFELLHRRLLKQHEENPQEVKFVKLIGDLYFEHRKDYRTAKEWYQKAARLNPHDSVLKDKVEDCDIRTYMARIKQAEAAKDPRLQEMRQKLLAFEIRAYERRVSDRPTDTLLHFELGLRYYRAKRIDEAIKEFQIAVRDPKRKVDSSVYLGNCFRAKRLFDLAEQNYRNASEGALGDQKLKYIWYHWARCREEWGKPERAIELYMKIVEKDYGYEDAAQRLETLRTQVG